MQDHLFDPWDLLPVLRERWPAVIICCGSACLLALAISAMLPKQFTATAEVLIQAPGGNDPRAATAVNPAYLESLKVYERLASSDTLFVRALDHVHAGSETAGKSIEVSKRRILRVSKVTNTAMLEISATMRDPRKAQALAQFIAEQAIQANLSMDAQTQTELTQQLRENLDASVLRLAQLREALKKLGPTEPLAALEGQLENNTELELSIEKDLSQARTDLAGDLAEPEEPKGPRDDTGNPERFISAARARITSLETQQRNLTTLIQQEGAQTQTWKDHRDALLADQKAAQTAVENATARLNDAANSAQLRGERLVMIDPGIVPQQPGSPDTPLNVLIALVFSSLGSLAWVVTSFGYERAALVRASRQPESHYSFRV